MPAALRSLPSKDSLLRAPSRPLRTTPTHGRQRGLYSAYLYSTNVGRRSGTLQTPGLRSRTASHVVVPAAFSSGQRRGASAAAAATVENSAFSGAMKGLNLKTDGRATANVEDIGPIQEYDRRVDSGLLRNDEHQRGRAQPWEREEGPEGPEVLTPCQA
jgi:protein AFG1